MLTLRKFLVVVTASVFVVSAITTSSSVFASSAREGVAAKRAASSSGTWKIEFVSPLSPNVAAALVRSAPAQLTMLAFEQEANTLRWVGEVNVAQAKTPAEVAEAFAALRLTTIADQLKQSADVMAQRGTEPSLVNVSTSLQATAREIRGSHVTGATAVAEEASIRRLATDSRVRGIRSLRPITAPPPTRTSRTSGAKPGLASPLRTVRSEWVPDDVYLTIWPQDSDRYSQQLIGWASGRTLNWCYRCGYEAIMFEYNYQNVHYLNADFWPGTEIPIVVTWSSSLPGAYLHTRWNDASPCPGCYKNEVAHSIGTNGWNWGQIYAGNFYSTYIRVTPGNSSTGKSKQAPTLTSCFGNTCDTWEMYHQDQCWYDYGNVDSFWPVRGLPVFNWHWNRNNGSDNGLQPGCM